MGISSKYGKVLTYLLSGSEMLRCQRFLNFPQDLKISQFLKGQFPIPFPPHTHSGLQLQASLLVQWLRVRLAMQGTPVRSPVQEDPTCHGATKHCNQDPAEPPK